VILYTQAVNSEIGLAENLFLTPELHKPSDAPESTGATMYSVPNTSAVQAYQYRCKDRA